MTKQDWEFQIGYVEEWLREHGYQLVQDSDEEDRVELQESVVYINSRQHPETRKHSRRARWRAQGSETRWSSRVRARTAPACLRRTTTRFLRPPKS